MEIHKRKFTRLHRVYNSVKTFHYEEHHVPYSVLKMVFSISPGRFKITYNEFYPKYFTHDFLVLESLRLGWQLSQLK